MKCAVLLRAVNVGGRTLPMAALRERLSELDVATVGAAGTLAIRRAPNEAAVRRAVRAAIPFSTDVLVRRVEEIDALLARGPGGEDAPPAGVRWSATFLSEAPDAPPKLPIRRPDGEAWQTEIVEIRGRDVLGRYRARRTPSERLVYPNEVTEREIGRPATTRWWETVVALGTLLGPRASPGPPSRPPEGRPTSRPRPRTSRGAR